MPAFYPEGDDPRIGDAPNRSLQKINSLLKSIDTKTGESGGGLTNAELRASPVPVDIGGSGSITITSGTVTVSNEVEVTNDSGNPIPVSGNVTANVESNDWETIGGQIAEGFGGVNVPVSIAGTIDANAGIPVVNDVDNYPCVQICGTGSDSSIGLEGVGGRIGFGGGAYIPVSVLNESLPISLSSVSEAPNTANNHPPKALQLGYKDYSYNSEEPAYRAVSDQTPLPVQGEVSVSNFPATQAVSGTVTANTGLSQPLTDAQLRATAVPVSGTFWQATQPVSGSVSVSNFPATQPVSGTVTANTGLSQPLTDAQLRATAVPVSASSLPLPSGAATSANQSTANTSLASIDADIGATADSAATSDTGTFSLIALVKRLLGKLPSLSGGRIPVDGSGVTQPVSLAAAISQRVQGWDIPIHDYRGLGYTSGNLTSVTYKTGGASGTTVATLTLGYDGSGNLTSVTKT